MLQTMDKKRLTRKTLYCINLVLLTAMILLSFFITMVFLYVEEDRSAKEKLAMLTVRVGEDLKSTLDRLDSMHKALFLTEGFQNNAEIIAQNDIEDEGVLERILEHFMLIISQDPYLAKNVIYLPRDSNGELALDKIIYYGYGYEYINTNIKEIIDIAALSPYRMGKTFYKPIYYTDRSSSLLFSISRNVFDIRAASYLEQMGIGIMFINTSHFTEALSYAKALDGLTITVNEPQGTVMSYGTDLPSESSRRYYNYNYPLSYFGWTVSGHYDTAYIWSALTPSIVSLGTVILLTGTVFIGLMLLLQKKSSSSLNYLFDNFSDIRNNQVYTPVVGTGDEEVDRVIHSFNTMFESVRTLNEEILTRKNQSLALELEKTEFTLKSLYSQINKHFLINVLSLIRSFVSLGHKDKLEACIEDLSDYLRYSLSIGDIKTIKEELTNVRSYLNIEQLWHSQIEFSVRQGPGTDNLAVPKLIIQPLIENALIHGLGRRKGTIAISVKRQGDSLYILVADDGAGIESSRLKEVNDALKTGSAINSSGKGNGLALSNVLGRLKLISGDDSTIRLISKQGKGTLTVVRLRARGINDA